MTRVPLPLSQLDAIGLDDLNASASLQTRKDRKYLVPLELVEDVVGREGLQILDIDGLRTFRYESVYFDTPERTSYLAAAHRRRRRFKVRTRSYLDSGLCVLEVKTRERRGFTEKHRLPYTLERRDRLNADARGFIDGFDTIAPATRQLERALTTRYDRTTLLETASGSRITIDTDLECETPEGSQLSLPHVAVVETKTSGQPCETDHLLWSAHQRPVSISKYCTGLAALTPDLPANKWNRVLRTYFGWSPEPTGPERHEPHSHARMDADRTAIRHPAWVPAVGGIN